MDSAVASAIETIEQENSFHFRDFQKEALGAFANAKDVFVCVPTGLGKTACYAYITRLWKAAYDKDVAVVVISPLIALMHEQVAKLTEQGVTACCITEDTSAEVFAGAKQCAFQYVFVSPEGVIRKASKSILDSVPYQKKLVALVVDEAHCITEWGEGFRPEYAKLGTLRALLRSDVHVMALTATATKDMKGAIYKSLCLSSDTVCVTRPSNRPNLRYSVYRVKAGSIEPLRWMVDTLNTTGDECPKTLVFCRNVKTVATAYAFFMKELGENAYIGEPIWQNRVVAMFHRSTHPKNKEHVLAEFPKPNSAIRILFTTIAFGMGVDIPDVRQVIHFGCARSLEAYAQETGRAGRDGKSADVVTLYHSQNLSKVQTAQTMCTFIKEEGCRRSFLMDHFSLQVSNEDTNAITKCKCCDNCSTECNCGNCTEFPYQQSTTVSDQELADSLPHQLYVDISSKEESLLRDNLQDYVLYLRETSDPGLLPPEQLYGYDETVIDRIMSSVGSIMSEDDLSTLTGIQHPATLTDIMTLIEEVLSDMTLP